MRSECVWMDDFARGGCEDIATSCTVALPLCFTNTSRSSLSSTLIMMAAVLPVDGVVDVEAVVRRMQRGEPPADVHEYLWRVRIEAEGIPDVVVAAHVDPRQFDARQTANMPLLAPLAVPADPALLPRESWRRALLADFAELRQLIARWQELGAPESEPSVSAGEELLRTLVPRMADADGWRAFFFGRAATPPHLRLLLQFDQVLTRRLLEYHAEWLEDVTALSRARAVWVYALLARLDKPVHAGVAATIRQLLRRCWHLRGGLRLEGGEREEGEAAGAAALAEEEVGKKEAKAESPRVQLQALNTGILCGQGKISCLALATSATAAAPFVPHFLLTPPPLPAHHVQVHGSERRGRGRREEHRRREAARGHHALVARPERYEQARDQPPGEDLRNERHGHDRQGARGRAPGRAHGRHGRQDAGERLWRRHVPRRVARGRAAARGREPAAHGAPRERDRHGLPEGVREVRPGARVAPERADRGPARQRCAAAGHQDRARVQAARLRGAARAARGRGESERHAERAEEAEHQCGQHPRVQDPRREPLRLDSHQGHGRAARRRGQREESAGRQGRGLWLRHRGVGDRGEEHGAHQGRRRAHELQQGRGAAPGGGDPRHRRVRRDGRRLGRLDLGDGAALSRKVPPARGQDPVQVGAAPALPRCERERARASRRTDPGRNGLLRQCGGEGDWRQEGDSVQPGAGGRQDLDHHSAREHGERAERRRACHRVQGPALCGGRRRGGGGAVAPGEELWRSHAGPRPVRDQEVRRRARGRAAHPGRECGQDGDRGALEPVRGARGGQRERRRRRGRRREDARDQRCAGKGRLGPPPDKALGDPTRRRRGDHSAARRPDHYGQDSRRPQASKRISLHCSLSERVPTQIQTTHEHTQRESDRERQTALGSRFTFASRGHEEQPPRTQPPVEERVRARGRVFSLRVRLLNMHGNERSSQHAWHTPIHVFVFSLSIVKGGLKAPAI
ncbi:hypothetical protein PybrP1_006925 [[Pythium] brassicae (nom. inval.)]|nr:hypothetical protein PybrP1_006925 [[Pythium] brassicae (nom. inval.)]